MTKDKVEYSRFEGVVMDAARSVANKDGKFEVDDVIDAVYPNGTKRPKHPRMNVNGALRDMFVKSMVIGPPFIIRISDLGPKQKGVYKFSKTRRLT